MTAKTPPSGQTVQAHMTVHDAAAAIGFYVKAFGAEELFRLVEPAGRVGHAEIRIGDTVLMMNDEYPDFGASSPAAIGGSPVAFRVLVPDADKAVEHAGAAGAGPVLWRPFRHGRLSVRLSLVPGRAEGVGEPGRNAEALDQDA